MNLDNEYRSYQHLFLARSIWKHVRLSTVHGIHRLDLLTRLPWLTSLIKNVAVELKWDPAFHESGSGENWHTEIRGELEEYLFCDRQAVLNRSVDAGYAGQDEDDPAYFGDGKLMEFTQGPDGRGFDPFIKNADDAINSLESSILRLHSLERFVWQTAVLPMPLSLCQHLSRLDTLRLLRLEQQGEFRSASEYLGMSCFAQFSLITPSRRTLARSSVGDFWSRSTARRPQSWSSCSPALHEHVQGKCLQ
mgnify:CR=1 FL=1